MGFIPPPAPVIQRIEPVTEGIVHFADSAEQAVRCLPRIAPEGHYWVRSTAERLGKACFHVRHEYEPDMGYNCPPTAWHLANRPKAPAGRSGHSATCHYCGRGRTPGNTTCDGCGAPVGTAINLDPPRPNPPRRVYE